MSTLPYVTAPGNVDKALAGIKKAAVPERISQDFVKTVLKIPGGSGAQITTYIKKLGLANSDGTPNDLYKKFRNPASSGIAIAEAIRHAYAPLYIRNEYMHELDDDGLLGLIVEETGEAHDSNPVRLIFNCIKHLKVFSSFQEKAPHTIELPSEKAHTNDAKELQDAPSKYNKSNIGLNLGYTINLNLPATTDPEVFNAIFDSLKKHLLRDEDA